MGIKYRKLSLSFPIVAIFLTSCSGGQISALPTSTVNVPPAAMSTPSPTDTPRLTFTPTATPTPHLPVLSGTQIPASDVVISADNIDQVVELARWGKGVITDAAYSPDGKLIGIATTLGVSLYDAETLDERVSIDTDASVASIAFSPDGKFLATGLIGNVVKLWGVVDGALFEILENPTQESISNTPNKFAFSNLSFSPDGGLIAGGSSNGYITLWQIENGVLINTIENPAHKAVLDIFFSPDGQSLFYLSGDGNVREVNALDGEQIHIFAGVSIRVAAISPDGMILATYESFRDPVQFSVVGYLYLWSVESGDKLQTIQAREPYFTESDISSLAFSVDGKSIGAAGEDQSGRIWNVEDGSLQASFDELHPTDGYGYYLNYFTVSFSPDGKNILLAGSNVFGIWDLETEELINRVENNTDSIIDIALLGDGQTLVSLEWPKIALLQFPSGTVVSSGDSLLSDSQVTFDPDGVQLLTSRYDNTVQFWSSDGKDVIKEFEWDRSDSDDGIQRAIEAIAVSPDGQTMALEMRYTGKVELRKMSDGSLIKNLQTGTKFGYSGTLIFTPDGKYLVASLSDTIRLFNLDDGIILGSFRGGLGVALHPDGSILAGGGEGKTITVWKIPGGEVLYTLKDQPDVVRAVTFSPNGEYLIAGIDDGTIEVFLAQDGELLKSWKGHTEGVRDVLFTPDGRYVISASIDGTVRVWGIKP